MRSWLHYECENITIEILPIPHWKFTYFSKSGHKSTRCKVCYNQASVLQQMTFALLVSLINLEHFLQSTLVLLLVL